MAQNITKGKKIYVTHINIRQSIFFLVLKLIVLDAMITLIAVLYFSLASNTIVSEFFSKMAFSHSVSFLLALVFLKVALTIYIVMRWINEYYEIWPDMLIHRSGFIFRKEERHPFSQMRSVKVEQGFFGKFLEYGTISLYNWYLKTDTALYLIHNPIKYFHIIEELIPKTEKERDIFLDDSISGEH